MAITLRLHDYTAITLRGDYTITLYLHIGYCKFRIDSSIGLADINKKREGAKKDPRSGVRAN